jgi:hypothetical protein
MMGKLVNQQKAKEFLDRLDDPVVRALIQDAYAKIFSEGVGDFEGEFDLLFLFRILAAFLQDREALAQALRGELERHPIAAD